MQLEKGFVFFILCLVLSSYVEGEEMTHRGAKITKSEFAKTEAPTLKIPDGWKLLEGDKWTGINPREYYFTLESNKKNDSDPVIQVLWPGVKIANVYGGSNVRSIKDGVEFKMNRQKTPTGFTTSLPKFGAVSMCIFHNLKGLQAGPYRDQPYPDTKISAQLNYLFAAREMMREAGFTESDKTIDATINLYGFETNFPNGHKDYPPHFHIMTEWNQWRDLRVTHFILDENGRILYNNHFVTENGKTIKEKCVRHKPDEDILIPDRSGDTKFILRILPDGTGLTMNIPGRKKEYKITSEDAVHSVSCYVREKNSDPWKLSTVSRVNDDARQGILTVITEKNGSANHEIWRYNPDTGEQISFDSKSHQ